MVHDGDNMSVKHIKTYLHSQFSCTILIPLSNNILFPDPLLQCQDSLDFPNKERGKVHSQSSTRRGGWGESSGSGQLFSLVKVEMHDEFPNLGDIYYRRTAKWGVKFPLTLPNVHSSAISPSLTSADRGSCFESIPSVRSGSLARFGEWPEFQIRRAGWSLSIMNLKFKVMEGEISHLQPINAPCPH